MDQRGVPPVTGTTAAGGTDAKSTHGLYPFHVSLVRVIIAADLAARLRLRNRRRVRLLGRSGSGKRRFDVGSGDRAGREPGRKAGPHSSIIEGREDLRVGFAGTLLSEVAARLSRRTAHADRDGSVADTPHHN
jgi:hypothetical protein